MSEFFNKYSILCQLKVKLTALAPLRIGRGKEEVSVVEPDLPVIKDASGHPIVPGSTMKGFCRANFQRILANLTGDKKAKQIVNDIFGDSDIHASTIYFGPLSSLKAELDVRKHIAINPETGAVRNLFEIELVKEGAEFSGRIVTRNLSPTYLSLLFALREFTNQGLFRLGGFKSRGYGLVKLDFEGMEIILPGISTNNLRQGVQLEPQIGTGKSVSLQATNKEITLKEIGELSFVTEEGILEAPEYFGVKILVSEKETEKLLSQLIGHLQQTMQVSPPEA